MLTRVRNALMVGHATVNTEYSKIKLEIARILKAEGYIEDYSESGESTKRTISIELKYYGKRRVRQPVITAITRISTPGRRVYVAKNEIPWVLSGMGTAIMSTPQGVMTGAEARRRGIGGEVIATVY
jgi:small subunit ribosomal protein S8